MAKSLRKGVDEAPEFRLASGEDPVVFANVCQVVATPEEVHLLFGMRDVFRPNEGKAVVRVVTTLQHAKRLTTALLNILGQYEAQFGVIEEVEGRKDARESDIDASER